MRPDSIGRLARRALASLRAGTRAHSRRATPSRRAVLRPAAVLSRRRRVPRLSAAPARRARRRRRVAARRRRRARRRRAARPRPRRPSSTAATARRACSAKRCASPRGASLEWLPLDTILFGGSRAPHRDRRRSGSPAHGSSAGSMTVARPAAVRRPLRGGLARAAHAHLRRRRAAAARTLCAGAPAIGCCQRAVGSRGFRRVRRAVRLPGTTTLSCVAYGSVWRRHPVPTNRREVRRRSPLRRDAARRAARRALPARPTPKRCATTFEALWRELRPDVDRLGASAPRIWKT